MLSVFPSEPRIVLDNYLPSLIFEGKNKNSSIYLNNSENFVKKLWDEIVLSTDTLNVKENVPKFLNVEQSALYAYKNGRKSISLNSMQKLVKMHNHFTGKNDFDPNLKELFCENITFLSRNQEVFLPKSIDPKLSYLMGLFVGDGNFSKSGYVIKISEKSTSQLEDVIRPLFYDIFGVKAPIFRRFGNGYAVQFGSKPIYYFLKNVLNLKVGKIPKEVYNFDEVNKSYFLRGIFDAEGCVISSRPRIMVAQKSKSFLEEFKSLSRDLGVNFNGPTFHKTVKGEWYTIRTDSKREFLNFYGKIGSNHVDKVPKIKNWVVEIENRNS